jgi:Rrf2 family transcriptional regulator, iron-sulfur cluster assembly transcription factor
VLPQTVEYGLRAMVHIAAQPGDVGVRAVDIADAASIPRHYVAKLLRRLVVAGLLTSRRGKGGGFALSRPAVEIRFVDVMRALDFGVTPDRCAFGYPQCKDDQPCPLHGAWSQLQASFVEWGERTTLADGTPPQ